jgi:hypothetical protein
MNLREQMDAIHGGAADLIPWNLTEPPQLLVFSSEGELRELFAKYFAVEQIGTVELGGKHGSHRVVACKMQRRA